jgi:hypothetical protein
MATPKNYPAFDIGQGKASLNLDSDNFIRLDGEAHATEFRLNGQPAFHPEQHVMSSHSDVSSTGPQIEDMVDKAHEELHTWESHPGVTVPGPVLEEAALKAHAEIHSPESHVDVDSNAAAINTAVGNRHDESHAWNSPQHTDFNRSEAQLAESISLAHVQSHLIGQQHSDFSGYTNEQFDTAVSQRHAQSHAPDQQHSDFSSTSSVVNDAVTKKHDQGGDTALGTQTQSMNAGGRRITGVGTPTADSEGAPLGYISIGAGGGPSNIYGNGIAASISGEILTIPPTAKEVQISSTGTIKGIAFSSSPSSGHTMELYLVIPQGVVLTLSKPSYAVEHNLLLAVSSTVAVSGPRVLKLMRLSDDYLWAVSCGL